MNIFHSILQKLGIEKPVTSGPAAESTKAAPGTSASSSPVTPATPAPVRPAAVPVVDVVSKLEGLAAARRAEKLDWKVSIVDLLKLLNLDSSPAARKELATELGCPADQMGDSAKMNTWLHKTVLQKIAENGGNIPASLLK
jgi:hypothetical protein